MELVVNACCEEWKAKLTQCESACAKLTGNAQLLKTKIIDTSTLLGLHKQLQAKMKQATEEIAELKKQNTNFQKQVEAEKRETASLKQQVEFLLASNAPTESKLKDTTDKLEATAAKLATKEAYVTQLEASVSAGKEASLNYDKVVRDCTRLRTELSNRNAQYTESQKNIKGQQATIVELRIQVGNLTTELEAANNTMLSQELEMGMLKDKKDYDTIGWESVEPSSLEPSFVSSVSSVARSSASPTAPRFEDSDEFAADFARDLEDSMELTVKRPELHEPGFLNGTQITNRQTRSGNLLALSGDDLGSPKMEKMSLSRIVSKESSPETSPPHKRTIAENRQRISRSYDEPSPSSLTPELSPRPPSPSTPQTSSHQHRNDLSPPTTPLTTLSQTTPSSPPSSAVTLPPKNSLLPILPTKRASSSTLKRTSSQSKTSAKARAVIFTPIPTPILIPNPTPIHDTLERSVEDAEMTDITNPTPPSTTQPLESITSPSSTRPSPPPQQPVSPITVRDLPSTPITKSPTLSTPVAPTKITDINNPPTASSSQPPPSPLEQTNTSSYKNPPQPESTLPMPVLPEPVVPLSTSPPEPKQPEPNQSEQNQSEPNQSVLGQSEPPQPEADSSQAQPTQADPTRESTGKFSQSESGSELKIEPSQLPEPASIESVSSELAQSGQTPALSESTSLPTLLSSEPFPSESTLAPSEPPVALPEPVITPSEPVTNFSEPATTSLEPPPIPEHQHEREHVEWEDTTELASTEHADERSKEDVGTEKEAQGSTAEVQEDMKVEGLEEGEFGDGSSLPEGPQFKEVAGGGWEEEEQLGEGQKDAQGEITEEGGGEHLQQTRKAKQEPQTKRKLHKRKNVRWTQGSLQNTPEQESQQDVENNKRRRGNRGGDGGGEPESKKVQGPELCEQHPIISSLLFGISKSVEIEAPLSPSLLPLDPIESEWAIDKEQRPNEPLSDYLSRRISLVLAPPSPGLSLATLNSCDDLFCPFYDIFCKHMDIVVHAFLKVLHECNATSKVETATLLFWQFFSFVPDKGMEFRNMLLNKVSEYIVHSTSFLSIAYLCELFGGICKSNGDFERFVFLAYKVVRKNHIWKTRTLSALAQSWPDPLIGKGSDRYAPASSETETSQLTRFAGDYLPLLNTIENLVALGSADQSNPEHQQEQDAYQALRRACYWPCRNNPETISLEVLISDLTQALVRCAEDLDLDAREGMFPRRAEVVIQAFELVSVYKSHDWNWTYQQIMVPMWALLNPSYAKPPNLTPAVLRLLGIVGRVYSNEEIVAVRSRIAQVFTPYALQNYAFSVQVCAALSLFDLCQGDTQVLAPCKDWYKALPHDKKNQLRHLTYMVNYCTK